MSKFLKIKDCGYMQKDPDSGAIVLSENKSLEDIKLDNVMKRLGIVEKQNAYIIELLEKLTGQNT